MPSIDAPKTAAQPVSALYNRSIGSMDLETHEAKSQSRYEHLNTKLAEIEECVEETIKEAMKEHHMDGSETKFITSGLGEGGFGGGFGGGGLGLIALLALLGGRRGGGGLLGGGDGGDGGCAALNIVTKPDIILDKLGNIQSEVSSAVAAAATSIRDGQQATNIALLAGFNNVTREVGASTVTLANAIENQGQLTRALITSNQIANLERMLGTANAQIIELEGDRRAVGRARDTEINVTQNVNQQQQQLQQQATLLGIHDCLRSLVTENQVIRATNQAINIGAGTQTANPLNTNNNVRT